jgi:phosphoglycolate phosphatase
MKTLLFDIDGTLIVTNSTGTHALDKVLRFTFGLNRPCLNVKFGGRTDFSLLREVLQLNGIPPNEENFQTFTTAYRSQLPESLTQCGGSVLPGVLDLLQRLKDHADIRCSIMTGNLKETATQKLEHFGLLGFFDSVFGGDHDADRRHLARRTALFLRGAYDHHSKDGTIVIGDTPADIFCGLDIDATVLAVCTGHFNRDALETAGAHMVQQDLSEVEAVFQWLIQ